MSSELEQRYHRLLRFYPPSYRDRRGEEMVGTLVESAAPGQTRPSRADRADLIAGAVREWLGIHAVRGLAPGLRVVAPIMLVLAAGYALSGWFLPGNDGVAGQRDTFAVVVSALWALAVLIRSVVPRAGLAALALAWLVTVAAGIAIAVAGRSTMADGGAIRGFPDSLTLEVGAGLVALIAVATVAGRPSTVERVVTPLAVAGLVSAAVLDRANEHWATRPGWTYLLWTLPVIALLVGLVVRVRTGSTSWLWAAALLLPLLPYGLMVAYVDALTTYPLLYFVLGPAAPVPTLTTMLVAGTVVAGLVGLAAVAAARGPSAPFRLGGSLCLGTAAGLFLFLAAAAAYHGGAAATDQWAILVPAVLSTVALLVPAPAARVLALLAAGSTVAAVLADRDHSLGAEFGSMGALFVLLVVGASAVGRPSSRGVRRAGVGALAGSFVLAAGASTVGFGRPLPWPDVDARVVIVPGIAAAVLVPLAYWSGRRLLLAGTGWVAAVPAFAGSALWITLLVVPVPDPAAVSLSVGGLVLSLLAGRIARRRPHRPTPQTLVP